MLLDEQKVKRLEAETRLDFEDALYAMRIGREVARRNWSDCRYSIKLNKQTSVAGFEPHFINSLDTKYRMSTEDILAEDWFLFTE